MKWPVFKGTDVHCTLTSLQKRLSMHWAPAENSRDIEGNHTASNLTEHNILATAVLNQFYKSDETPV